MAPNGDNHGRTTGSRSSTTFPSESQSLKNHLGKDSLMNSTTQRPNAFSQVLTLLGPRKFTPCVSGLDFPPAQSTGPEPTRPTIGVLAADEMLIGLQDAPELGVIVGDHFQGLSGHLPPPASAVRALAGEHPGPGSLPPDSPCRR